MTNHIQKIKPRNKKKFKEDLSCEEIVLKGDWFDQDPD